MSNLKVADRIVENTSSAAGIFQREWRLYRKIVDLNYCAHREVYGRLRRVLVEEIELPFRSSIPRAATQSEWLAPCMERTWWLTPAWTSRRRLFGSHRGH
jgi:hypothetical protein